MEYTIAEGYFTKINVLWTEVLLQRKQRRKNCECKYLPAMEAISIKQIYDYIIWAAVLLSDTLPAKPA